MVGLCFRWQGLLQTQLASFSHCVVEHSSLDKKMLVVSHTSPWLSPNLCVLHGPAFAAVWQSMSDLDPDHRFTHNRKNDGLRAIMMCIHPLVSTIDAVLMHPSRCPNWNRLILRHDLLSSELSLLAKDSANLSDTCKETEAQLTFLVSGFLMPVPFHHHDFLFRD